MEPNDLIRRIASVVGHELRNPLAVMKNSAYFVKKKLEDVPSKDPKLEKHIGIIESEIERADRMIADMLAFSRPLEIRPAKASLNVVVEEFLSSYAPPPKVVLEKSLAPENPSVLCDAGALKDALKRLFDNAAEAMPDGGQISVGTGTEPGWAWVEVRDRGPGVPAEAQKEMLEPFFTTKPRGLGLGLPATLKVVTAHQGKLDAKNLAGGGAAFKILLPQAQD